MENASKALIIAGAILISILLISVGVLIMNSTSGVTSGMDSSAKAMEMQSFNSQFTPYAGAGISASQVRSLVSVVISSNATNDNHIISIRTSGDGYDSNTLFTSGTSTTSELAKINQGLDSTYKFRVELIYDNDGFVEEIVIK